MSNLIDFAKKELELVDLGYDGMLNDAVLELIKVFANEGHSGLSASACVDAFSKLAMFMPLSPLEDKEDDWIDHPGDTVQHKRCSTVFKNIKENKIYMLDGILFSDDGGETYYSSKDGCVELNLPCMIPETQYKILK